MKKTLLIGFILSIIPLFILADRAVLVRKKLEKLSGKTIGTYRALVIGINDYQDPKIPDLKTPVNDARGVASVLKGVTSGLLLYHFQRNKRYQ